MKKIFTIMFLMLLVMFTSRTLAIDTLTVFAKGPTLDVVINGDVDANGMQKHAYKLVSLDTTYIFDATITVKSDLSVIGVLGPDVNGKGTGRPPCIQPDVLGNGSIPAYLFVVNGNNTKATFKNLYLMGLSLNGAPTPTTYGRAIRVTADYVKTYVDNCVFEEWRAFAIGYTGNWDGFWITNNRFRNTVDPTQQYEGEVIRCEAPGTGPTDTLIMRYNTMFCINAYSAAPVTKVITNYFEFTHNSVIYTFKNPFFIFNLTNGKVNNNLFYAPCAVRV